MYLAAVNCRQDDTPRIARCSTDRDIRNFLSGRTNGEDVLHALYDHVLDEAVPERLLDVLRR